MVRWEDCKLSAGLTATVVLPASRVTLCRFLLGRFSCSVFPKGTRAAYCRPCSWFRGQDTAPSNLLVLLVELLKALVDGVEFSSQPFGLSLERSNLVYRRAGGIEPVVSTPACKAPAGSRAACKTSATKASTCKGASVSCATWQ